MLDAAGWRPDCAVGSGVNVAKRLPPKDTRGFLLIGHPDLPKYATSEGVLGYQGWLDDPSGGTGLTTFVFFQDGFRASRAPQIDRSVCQVRTAGFSGRMKFQKILRSS